MAESIAVYGGSFDPPHIGHTLVCAYVLGVHPIDRILVLPVANHAFSKRLAGFEHRVRMCELAFRDVRRVEVSCLERELPAPNRTLHTLELLQQREPTAHLRLLIGSDLLAETASWFEFDRVRALAPPIVVPRAGYASPEAPGPALPDVNSSELRRRLRAGEDTLGLLDPQVAAYARSHGLYSPEPSEPG